MSSIRGLDEIRPSQSAWSFRWAGVGLADIAAEVTRSFRVPLLLAGLAGDAYLDNVLDRVMPLLGLVWLPPAAAPQLDFPLFGFPVR